MAKTKISKPVNAITQDEKEKKKTNFSFAKLSARQLIGTALTILFVALCIVFSIVTITSDSNNYEPYNASGDYVVVNTNWEVDYSDGSKETINLGKVFSLKSKYKGETIIKGNVDLSLYDGIEPYLVFYANGLFIDIYVDMNDDNAYQDDELIQSFQYTESMKNSNPISTWFFVKMDSSYQGHEISLVLTKGTDYSTYLGYVYLGNATSIYHSIYIKSIVRFIIGIILTLAALAIAIVSFASSQVRKSAAQIPVLSAFGVCVGLYTIFDSGMFQLVSSNQFIFFFLSTACLALGSFFLAFHDYLKASNVTFLHIGRANIWASISLFLVLILAAFTNFIQVTTASLIVYIVLAITVTLSFVNSIFAYKSNKKNLLFFVVSLILLLGGLMELIIFTNHLIYASSYALTLSAAFTITVFIISEYKTNVQGAKKKLKEQQQQQEQKVAIMLAQIQPHFLYNSLNSIAILCNINPKQAHDLTIKFSQYLRNNIDALSQQTPILFSTELKNIRNYLEIEKIRFSDKLSVVENIQVSDFYVPVLTVQPIVENAVKHGISKRSTPGAVMISTNQDLNNYYIIIEDNGVGFDPSILETSEKLGKSIGLTNVKYRLKSMVNADLKIQSTIGKGTKVTITLPIVSNNKK